MKTESLRQQWSHSTVAGHPGYEAMLDHAIALERLLGKARDAFKQIAHNPGNSDDTGFTSGHISRDLLARIDATLDPNNLEGPPRTREEMAADARELDAVAPTPAEKFALMLRGMKEVQTKVSKLSHEEKTRLFEHAMGVAGAVQADAAIQGTDQP